MGYTPRLTVFACNWCSYAGADTAGVNRLPVSPHIRVIRVMCSARVNPAFVLSAFENRADGVLISGCHMGDCHYVSGNEKAVSQFDKTKQIVTLLGIHPDRIRLEWISSAEGIRFANVINEFTARLSELGPLELASPLPKGNGKSAPIPVPRGCQECGKCTSLCPVSRHDGTFSPRRVLSRIMGSGKPFGEADLWKCLGCKLCEEVCPSGIPYSDMVYNLRKRSFEAGNNPTLTHCGTPFFWMHIQGRSTWKQDRVGWLNEPLKVSREGDLLLFAGCTPYLDAYFSDLGAHTRDSITGMVRILNHMGIVPAMLDDECCCGADLLLSGDEEGFQRLRDKNSALIRSSGARKMLFPCPECFHAFRSYYRDLNLEMEHVASFLAREMGRLPLGPPPPPARKQVVAFQDPCRLGRFSGIYEEPRAVIRALPGIELREMEHNKNLSTCCGGTCWQGCTQGTRSMQKERLKEALAVESDRLVTACPKCEIHLTCAKENSDIRIPLVNLVSLVSEHLNGSEVNPIVHPEDRRIRV